MGLPGRELAALGLVGQGFAVFGRAGTGWFSEFTAAEVRG
ncbi:hypothetical protein Pd630_LPD07930 [Rhodococcus opacus PD630]|nr:hypothetical protein Pd630_LPD07930 [Rhodococcus opacus PD630]